MCQLAASKVRLGCFRVFNVFDLDIHTKLDYSM
jgi:hypothetical protein